jgi:TonB family protein
MHVQRTILSVVAMVCIAPLLNAQFVRINDADKVAPNGGMAPPTVLKSTLTIYTDDARAHGIEGTVTIEASMSEDGRITNMRVLNGLGFGLDEAALASVQEWEFSPATRDGIPISVVAEIDVPFSLASANAFRVGNGVTPPKVQSRVEPQYTAAARLARIMSGTVVMQVVIKKDGTVDVLRVVQGLGGGLTNSAVDAIKQWKFSPGQKDGQAVDVALNIEVNFNLKK